MAPRTDESVEPGETMRLHHIGYAVKSIDAYLEEFVRPLLMPRSVSEPVADPIQRVRVCFVELRGAALIELVEPLGEGSPIAAFLQRSPSGGMHHVCYEVDDILAARDRLKAAGARVLGDGEPRIGAHGKPVLFLHPKDFCGTLVELEQA